MSEFHIHSPNFTTIHVENHTRQELNESLDAALQKRRELIQHLGPRLR